MEGRAGAALKTLSTLCPIASFPEHIVGADIPPDGQSAKNCFLAMRVDTRPPHGP
jgi:hypothetical protein